jgi:recombination associated protein RdgC
MFSIDRECELKAADESKAVVRYKNHPLDTDEVQEHVQHGKLPVSLAMTFDDRVSFVLTDTGRLKSIRMLDGVLENAGDDGGFDTDVAIATGELSKLVPRLLKALGGTADRSIGGSDKDADEVDDDEVDDDDDPAAGL